MCGRIKGFFRELSYENTKVSSVRDKSRWLNVLCFYVFGTLTFFNQEMLFPAAEDILSGRNLPTATVLVCFVTPLMITKLTAPWFVQRISYAVKTCSIALCMSIGLTLVAFCEDIKVQLLGIALNAMATGASEVVFLALTSFYPGVCISSFVAGTGMASLFSPNYYTGLTTWSCVSPKTAIMTTIPLPLLLVAFYALVLEKDFEVSGSDSRQKGKELEYKIVGSTPDDDDGTTDTSPEKHLCSEKLQITYKILPFITALSLSFFSEYLSISSVVTTIGFPSSKVRPRDHYIFYTLSYEIGKFVGRSYMFLFAFLPSDAMEFLRCSKTWVFTVLEMAHLIFFLFESWYHFVPYIWIIIALCSTLGLVAGMIVVHSPHAASQHVSPEEREFALGLLTIGNGVGGFLAGLVGLAVEPQLRKACTKHFSSAQEFCFTRMQNSTAWEANMHCF